MFKSSPGRFQARLASSPEIGHYVLDDVTGDFGLLTQLYRVIVFKQISIKFFFSLKANLMNYKLPKNHSSILRITAMTVV